MKFKTCNRISLITKIGLIFLLAFTSFLTGCGEAPANNAPAKPANIAPVNTIVTPSGNYNAVSNLSNTTTQGVITMNRDPKKRGTFKCGQGEKITLKFQAKNTTSGINYNFINENKGGTVTNNELEFTCDRDHDLALFFSFNGQNGSYKVVFSSNSGVIIDDELEIKQRVGDEEPKQKYYKFKL